MSCFISNEMWLVQATGGADVGAPECCSLSKLRARYQRVDENRFWFMG